MAEGKPAKKRAQNSAGATKAEATFTDEERAAMREYAQERKTASRRGAHPDKAEEERAVLEKITAMAAPDRALAERLHEIVTSNAPGLSPKLWYGMPAYANKDGNMVCFFQGAQKFKTRYATLGFSDKAHLDDGQMWPTAFALKTLSGGEEARIADLVKRATD